ncbi:MAG: hypothetical protein ACK5DD_03925 [Cyclobacteriaceae bacterium]|jgi:hypothetical protein
MSRSLISILMAGLLVLAASMLMMYAAAFALPSLSEEYYSTVFRSSNFEGQWLFYIHPFVLSAALFWFWHHLKDQLSGGRSTQAVEFGARYGVVAMLPVLLLTFSAIDISFLMVITWLFYGIIQAIVAGLVYAGRHS